MTKQRATTVEAVEIAAKTISRLRHRKGFPFVQPRAVSGYCPPAVWDEIAKESERLYAQIEHIYDRFEIGPVENRWFRRQPRAERDRIVSAAQNGWH